MFFNKYFQMGIVNGYGFENSWHVCISDLPSWTAEFCFTSVPMYRVYPIAPQNRHVLSNSCINGFSDVLFTKLMAQTDTGLSKVILRQAYE